MSNKDYTKYSREPKESVVEPKVEEVVDEVIEAPVEVVEEPVNEQPVEPEVVEQVEPEVPEKSETKIGVVTGCSKLNVRCEAWSKAPIICEIEQNTEVEIDVAQSTSDFYKVCLASGIEGFCVKAYIIEK